MAREVVLDTRKEELAYVQQAQAGEKRGFAALYRMHADRLYRQVIYPCLPHAESAEDVLKETFVKVMEQIHNYRWDPQRGIFPWLARIAKNRALDQHRKRGREQRFQGAYHQTLETLTPSAETPEQQVSAEQEQQCLQQHVQLCLQALNPRYRMVLELRMFQEKSREECAALLDVQLGTLDVLFHRALRSFRKQWEKQGLPS